MQQNCKNVVSLQTFSQKHTGTLKQGYKVALLILLILLIDQALKFYIKTNFEMNEEVKMFGLEWARLHFVENKGMAFGIEFNLMFGGVEFGKLLLSTFRILMVTGLIWYMRMLLRAAAPMGFIYCVGLITAGALGNIIDSTFYALIFSGGFHDEGVAHLTQFGQGYGHAENLPMNGFLHGRVVDMFYFPITTINLPEWLGGDSYLFFSPIFNVADASITTGIFSILLFQRRFFRDGYMEEHKATETVGDEQGINPPEAIDETEREQIETAGISSEEDEARENNTDSAAADHDSESLTGDKEPEKPAI